MPAKSSKSAPKARKAQPATPAAKKPKLLGNDPFERGAAPRPGEPSFPPERSRQLTPELQAPVVWAPRQSTNPASPPRVEAQPALPAPAAPPPASREGLLSSLTKSLRASFGFSSRRTEVDTWGRDDALTDSLRPLAHLLYEKYWRVQVEGAEHVPSGPCLIVANHAGALPLDGPVLHLALRRERPELQSARWLLEDQVFHAPFVGVLANRLGAVRASPENALGLLAEGRPVIVFPEGFHGLSKPFSERYQLRRFGRGGSVKIALRAKVPIIPVAIVGGEESMPLLGKLPGGLFGVDYLPLTLPPLPARWTIRFDAPLSMEGAPGEPEDDLAWVERTNLRLRERIETMLAELLSSRGRVF